MKKVIEFVDCIGYNLLKQAARIERTSGSSRQMGVIDKNRKMSGTFFEFYVSTIYTMSFFKYKRFQHT